MNNFAATTPDGIDTALSDSTIHIKVDSDHVQKNMYLSTFMLEQMVLETYKNAVVTKDFNSHGLLTDIWIKFEQPCDAVHFKLKNTFN